MLALSGCATNYVSRGADLYAGGHYVEAAEVFERTERRLDQCPIEDRARYGLYRGATLLALGDMPRAHRWLTYTAVLVQSDHSALSPEDEDMLQRALTALASYEVPEPPSQGQSGAVAATGIQAQAD